MAKQATVDLIRQIWDAILLKLSSLRSSLSFLFKTILAVLPGVSNIRAIISHRKDSVINSIPDIAGWLMP